MKKIISILTVILLLIGCNSKQSAMADLNAKRDIIKKQIDSVAHLQNELLNTTDPLNRDFATLSKLSDYESQRDILDIKMKRITFSIDSLSKY